MPRAWLALRQRGFAWQLGYAKSHQPWTMGNDKRDAVMWDGDALVDLSDGPSRPQGLSSDDVKDVSLESDAKIRAPLVTSPWSTAHLACGPPHPCLTR